MLKSLNFWQCQKRRWPEYFNVCCRLTMQRFHSFSSLKTEKQRFRASCREFSL